MHTHHSHSGSFCQHAVDDIEQIIKRAIELKMHIFCTTEHIPRLKEEHLYPEELDSGTSVRDLATTFDSYFSRAKQLKKKYETQIKMYIGFEGEMMDKGSCEFLSRLLSEYQPDLWVGSVHFVNEVPIDFDKASWEFAKTKCGGSIECLFRAYFDLQYELITRMAPPVIGHFDLIRLFSSTQDLSSVWELVERNITEGIRRGCLFEINTSAISKGWDTPYPKRDIAKVIASNGGKFCLSDDSHSITHVARNYGTVAGYLESINVNEINSVDGTVITREELRKWANENL